MSNDVHLNNNKHNIVAVDEKCDDKATANNITITPEGLKMYFRMLGWLQELDRQTVFNELLGQLHRLALRIKELRDPCYNILRTHFNIGALAFEQDLFSTDDYSADIITESNNNNSSSESTTICENGSNLNMLSQPHS